jgi:hypothetical protein
LIISIIFAFRLFTPPLFYADISLLSIDAISPLMPLRCYLSLFRLLFSLFSLNAHSADARLKPRRSVFACCCRRLARRHDKAPLLSMRRLPLMPLAMPLILRPAMPLFRHAAMLTPLFTMPLPFHFSLIIFFASPIFHFRLLLRWLPLLSARR